MAFFPRAFRCRAWCALLVASLLWPAGAAVPQAGAPRRGAESWYQEGARLMQRRRPVSAEVALQNALRASGKHFKTHLALAQLYRNLEPALALWHLEIARDLRPTSDQVQYQLGRALERRERWEQAAEHYRQAIRLNASHYAANRHLREILRRLRAQKSVVQRASEAFWEAPSLRALTLFGRIVLREAQPRQALWEFEEIRRRQPDLPEVSLWIARAHRLGKAPEEEIAAYRDYLAHNPAAVGVRLVLVQRLIAARLFREAEPALSPLIRPEAKMDAVERGHAAFLQSRLHIARGDLAQVGALLAEAGRLGFAEAAVTAAFRRDGTLYPEQASLWLAAGTWHGGRGRTDEAADALRRAGTLAAAVRPEARRALEALISAHGAFPAARLARGELALADGKPTQALRDLEAVPAGDPAAARAALLAGVVQRERGNLTGSIDALLRYVLGFSDPAEMSVARGTVLWELGQRDAATAVWQQQGAALTQFPEALARLARHLQTQGRAAEELRAREQLRGAAPHRLPNRLRLGDMLLAAGRWEEAAAEWATVTDRRTGDFELLLRLGRLYLQHADEARGLATLRRAEQIKPLGLRYTEMLARHHFDQGRAQEALPLYWRLYEANPTHPELPAVLPELVRRVPASREVRLVAARMAEGRGNADLAITLLEESLRVYPRQSEARTMLAGLFLAQNAPEAAEQVLKEARQEDGGTGTDGVKLLELLTEAQERLGRREALAKTLTRLEQAAPDNPAHARRRGLLLSALERSEEAVPPLQRALRASPGDQDVLYALARAHLRLRQGGEAEQTLARLLAAHPDHGPGRGAMIDLLQKAQRWRELPPHLEWWLERHPADGTARYNAVVAYLRNFDRDRARTHYAALRRDHPHRARALAPYFP